MNICLQELSLQHQLLKIHGIRNSAYSVNYITSEMLDIEDVTYLNKSDSYSHVVAKFNITDNEKTGVKTCTCFLTLYQHTEDMDLVYKINIKGTATFDKIGDSCDTACLNTLYRFCAHEFNENRYDYKVISTENLPRTLYQFKRLEDGKLIRRKNIMDRLFNSILDFIH